MRWKEHVAHKEKQEMHKVFNCKALRKKETWELWGETGAQP